MQVIGSLATRGEDGIMGKTALLRDSQVCQHQGILGHFITPEAHVRKNEQPQKTRGLLD